MIAVCVSITRLATISESTCLGVASMKDWNLEIYAIRCWIRDLGGFVVKGLF